MNEEGSAQTQAAPVLRHAHRSHIRPWGGRMSCLTDMSHAAALATKRLKRKPSGSRSAIARSRDAIEHIPKLHAMQGTSCQECHDTGRTTRQAMEQSAEAHSRCSCRGLDRRSRRPSSTSRRRSHGRRYRSGLCALVSVQCFFGPCSQCMRAMTQTFSVETRHLRRACVRGPVDWQRRSAD